MFPHTITIFNLVNDTYYRKVVTDVFATTKKVISPEGKGEKYMSVHDVIFSDIAMKDYLDVDSYKALKDKSDNYTLKNNDVVVIGEFDDIEDLSDIQRTNVDYFLIKTISINNYGSEELQSIEVTD